MPRTLDWFDALAGDQCQQRQRFGGRYSERYADHAVAIARPTVFIVIGAHPGRPQYLAGPR